MYFYCKRYYNQFLVQDCPVQEIFTSDVTAVLILSV